METLFQMGWIVNVPIVVVRCLGVVAARCTPVAVVLILALVNVVERNSYVI